MDDQELSTADGGATQRSLIFNMRQHKELVIRLSFGMKCFLSSPWKGPETPLQQNISNASEKFKVIDE